MNREFLPEDVQFRQVREIFLESAGTSLGKLEDSIRHCPRRGFDIYLNEVCRLWHNLKGSSLQLGFTEIGEVAERMEDLGEACRSAKKFPAPDRAQMLQGVRTVGQLLRKLSGDAAA